MTDESGFIQIADPDAPVFRIMPVWSLEEALRLRQLALVPPSFWEDPFEQLPEHTGVTINGRGPVLLDTHVAAAFGQCWSQRADSDTLWRAYSRVARHPRAGRNTLPHEEGARVRSTPRKLLTALRQWRGEGGDETCFVGSVQYRSDEDVKQQTANFAYGAVAAGGEDIWIEGRDRADLLLLKRDGFAHEAEVRLIYATTRQVDPDRDPRSVLVVPVDPSDLFEEVVFDPRLATFERKEREAVVRSRGYEGAITESPLYQNVILDVHGP